MQSPVQVKIAAAFSVGEVLWAGLGGPVCIKHIEESEQCRDNCNDTI